MENLIVRQKKGEALALRIAELRGRKRKDKTGCALAQHLGKTRDTVAKWKTGKGWPSRTEEGAIEDWLAVQRGFFARIAAGRPYEEARQEQPVFPAEGAPASARMATPRTILQQVMAGAIEALTITEALETQEALLRKHLTALEGLVSFIKAHLAPELSDKTIS